MRARDGAARMLAQHKLAPGRRPILAGLTAVALLYAAFVIYQFVDIERIPPTVPGDAIEIPLPSKTHGWVKCAIERSETRCQVFNPGGETITDDVFLAIDGGSAITVNELNIDANRTGTTYVRLKNGRLLLPRTNFEEHKAFAERVLEP